MNAEEFLREALESDACPENFTEIYREFQTYQTAALSTLTELHRVCEINHVNYQLAYGSLLGVIRDGGQIPWDYDIDVIVPYEEKEALIQALEKDLDPGYYYYCPEKNKHCRHMIMRLAPVEYKTEAIHVDVFFLIGSPEDPQERRDFEVLVRRISVRRYGKLVNAWEESNGSFRRYARLLLKFKLPAIFASLSAIEEEYKALCSRYSSQKSSFCISADSYATWKDYPTKLMWETVIIQTDFGPIRIPVHYKEILELCYGDYMTVPPLEKRIQDVIHQQRRIRRFNEQNHK